MMKINGNEIEVNFFKVIFTTLILFYALKCIGSSGAYSFLDGANLVIHEGGHMLFFWFGRFMSILGGTIAQLFVPFAIMMYFFFSRKEPYSATVAMFWFGESFLNVSVYARDALRKELPLVGVGSGEPEHDWNNILFELGLLRQTETVANIIFGLGVIVIVASIILGYYYSIDRKLSIEENLVVNSF